MKKVLHKRTPPPDDDCCGSLPCELDLIVTCTRTAAKHVGCNGIYIYIYIYFDTLGGSQCYKDGACNQIYQNRICVRLACCFVSTLSKRSTKIIHCSQRLPFLFRTQCFQRWQRYFPSLKNMHTRSAGKFKGWLYIKIVIFRCVNTVVIILIITPHTSTII